MFLDRCRLIIVDDDPAIRSGLRSILESAGADVAAEADSGQSGIEQAQHLSPDVILLDVSMPGMSGFATARELRKRIPALRIIFISQYCDSEYAEEALKIGASGYVLKEAAGRELTEAVDAALAGRTFVSPKVLSKRKHAQQGGDGA